MLKNKKYLYTIGSLIALTPAMSLVACSSSWTKWNPSNLPSRPQPPEIDTTKAEEKLWKVRYDQSDSSKPSPDLLQAYDQEKQIIDLSLINNQYELMVLVSYILNFSSKEAIDSYWNQPLAMQSYINKLNTNPLNLRLVYQQKEDQLSTWDISTYTKAIDQSISDYVILPIEEQNKLKKFNVEEKGLDENGLPVDFMAVAIAGAPLMEIDIVKGLLMEDTNFALKLSKLVNLPEIAFSNFELIMRVLDTLLKEIYQSPSFELWFKQYDLSMEIMPSGYHYGLETNSAEGRFQGQFLILNFKK